MSIFNTSSFYDFSYTQSDIKSLIHTIALHGNDLVGVELGVYKAESFCALLQLCPNIKKLYGIDKWQPYEDYLKDPYDEIPNDVVGEKEVEFHKLFALHSIKYSPNSEKAIILEEDSNQAVNKFTDESLDFIFIDTYMNKKQAEQDLSLWYPKIKKGGLFAGHDWDVSVIQDVVNEFREKNSIKSLLSTYDRTWVWKK